MAVYADGGDEPPREPACAPGCAPPLYRMPQTQWSAKLFWQMAVYVTWILVSMAAGALAPTIIAWREYVPPPVKVLSASRYAYCPAGGVANYTAPPPGYPPSPLATNGSRLIDTRTRATATLRGVSWFGFNNAGGMVDGLWVGGARGDTDLAALAYQIRLLGFNAVRLPFTFADLEAPGRSQVMDCDAGAPPDWARRAADPGAAPAPDFAAAPAPPVFLPSWRPDLCNTYVPGNATGPSRERLLWALQFFVASGFYVVLDYHPPPADPLPGDAAAFARAWLRLWGDVTCLPNFGTDLRGRLVLDLLNEPGLALGGRGVAWRGSGGAPGLDELYLSTMDAVHALSPGDALFMVQGTTAAGGGGGGGGFGLTPGDGFVTDPALIARHGLSDARPFFNELLARPHLRVLLAPHVYPPAIAEGKLRGARAPAGGRPLFDALSASWGRLARGGYCNATRCQRFPVVVGEMGSELAAPEDASFYADAAAFLAAKGDLAGATAPAAGWFWWSFNHNSAVTGGIVARSGRGFNWAKLRLLVASYGLRPWYRDPTAFTKQLEAEHAAVRARREAEEDAAIAAAGRKRRRGAAPAPAAGAEGMAAAAVPAAGGGGGGGGYFTKVDDVAVGLVRLAPGAAAAAAAPR